MLETLSRVFSNKNIAKKLLKDFRAYICSFTLPNKFVIWEVFKTDEDCEYKRQI